MFNYVEYSYDGREPTHGQCCKHQSFCCCQGPFQNMSLQNESSNTDEGSQVNKYEFLVLLKMCTVPSACICAKKGNWTTIALTNRIQDAARSVCRSHRSIGAWKGSNMRWKWSSLGVWWFHGTYFPILMMVSATYLNGTLPRRKLIIKAHVSGTDPKQIPKLKLWKQQHLSI